MNYFKNNNEIYFSKFREKAIFPSRKLEDAGYDFYACFDEDFILLEPEEIKLIPTGISWASSPSYFLYLTGRSKMSSIGLDTRPGVIDSGYRGEIRSILHNGRKENLVISNISEEDFKRKYKDIAKTPYYFYPTTNAIVQGLIQKVENVDIKEMPYQELLTLSSSRREKGFGSSDKK